MKKKGKKCLAFFLCTILSVLSVFPSLAAEKLRAPSWVKWGEIPGEITYEVVPEAEGEYRYRVYKDGEPYYQTVNINQHGTNDYYYRITESGDYTFQVAAIGDGITTEESDLSEMSEVFSYHKPDVALGEPQNLRWSPTDHGVAMWEAPSGSSEFQDILRYRLHLYKGESEKKGVLIVEGVDGTSYDLSKHLTEETSYTFSVQALSRDITRVTHGKETFGSGAADIPEENNGVLDALGEINNSYASPSDAVKELKKLDTKDLAIAMQSNEEVLNTVKELESKYLSDLNAAVETSVSSDVGIQSEEIELVGAGMNLASGSNAVRFEMKKPEQEAKVDPALYKNTFQVDLSLKGVEDKLFVPVRITMPIPSNIKPDRLVLLHHHKDGSYETVPLTMNDDGTVSFTVTSFSVFTFAEEAGNAEDPENPTPPVEPEVPETPSTSGENQQSGDESSVSVRNYNSPGSWEKDGNGWKFKKQDGTYPSLIWIMNRDRWYWFDENGYMKTGWVLYEGRWYYLNPQAGEQEGSMLTGWQLIQGKWYYLNPISNGFQGAMYVNTVTPDGYTVGNDGSWVE